MRGEGQYRIPRKLVVSLIVVSKEAEEPSFPDLWIALRRRYASAFNVFGARPNARPEFAIPSSVDSIGVSYKTTP